jgi:asparaginyl-tRNA synthetase
MDKRTIDLLKVRAFIQKKAREWFDDFGFIEVQGPILIPALSESPNSLEVKYFEKKAYLTKGFLPYGMGFANSLGKVYTIAPGFRKEQTDNRHLVEYWRLEAVNICDLKEMMALQEKLVAYLFQSLISLEGTLNCFQRTSKELARVQAPFIRLSYGEALKILELDGYKIFWGEEIDWKLEHHLSFKFDTPFFVWKYPISGQTNFSQPDTEKSELSSCADLIAPEGYGEIASSLQMVTTKENFDQFLKDSEISIEDQIWLSGFFQSYDGRPYSAFAIGLERLLQWVCKLADIKEATAFPRLQNEIYP